MTAVGDDAGARTWVSTLQGALSLPSPQLVRLHCVSRRAPVALATVAAIGVGLALLLRAHWDTYGALQLPLVFETAASAVISIATTGPFGEPERATPRWLPLLRLGLTFVLGATAVSALVVAAATAHLAGGSLDVLRNTAGLTGIGLLCAAWLGGGLAWVGPTGYMLVGLFGLYKDWHGPALTTPWLWPARPPHDLGAALCASLVFSVGMIVVTFRGPRDRAGE
jgi:hypothetical protein